MSALGLAWHTLLEIPERGSEGPDVFVPSGFGVILDLELQEGQLGHLDLEGEALLPDGVEPVVVHRVRLALRVFVIRVSTDPDLDVRIDYFAFELSVRSGDMQSAHDCYADLPGRKEFGIESGGRGGRVSDGRIAEEGRLQDVAAATVGREASTIVKVLFVFRLII